jgi:hypothetical protein
MQREGMTSADLGTSRWLVRGPLTSSLSISQSLWAPCLNPWRLGLAGGALTLGEVGMSAPAPAAEQRAQRVCCKTEEEHTTSGVLAR